MIIDAANVMFNQDSTSVVVRLAQSGDVQIQPTSKPTMQADSNPRPVQQQVKTGSVKQANEEQPEVVIKKELSNESSFIFLFN
jgi:hypothetical protein